MARSDRETRRFQQVCFGRERPLQMVQKLPQIGCDSLDPAIAETPVAVVAAVRRHEGPNRRSGTAGDLC